MKTILSGVQTWTKGKIKESTADWNQNDSNADNYVKNRTHWEEVQKKTLVSNEKVSNYWGANIGPIQLEEGTIYVITVDGVRYEVAPWIDEFWGTWVGNRLYVDGVDDGSGVPFAFDGGYIIAPFGEYTISVSTLIDGVETEVIEEQIVYVMWFWGLGENTLYPGNVYRVKFDDDTYEFTAVENADASAVIIGDMFQYPCEVWCYDGWLELFSMAPGYHYIDIVDVTNNSEIVSECLIGEYGWWSTDAGIKLPKLQEGESYTVTWNGVQYTCIGKNFEDGIYIGNNVYFYLDGFAVNPVDTKEPFVFGYYPMDDFAFVCLSPNQIATFSVARNETVVHKLDSKYLDLDLSNKMDAKNPVGFGSFSMNRLEDSAIGAYSHAEGLETTASYDYSHAEGFQTVASAIAAHAEGYMTEASDQGSHAEGISTIASGGSSHAEGNETTASGYASHAEGYITRTDANATARTTSSATSGYASHAEGYGTVARGAVSHAEGNGTTASGVYSHSEGYGTTASAAAAHAEGNGSKASGSASHAEGNSTASGDCSHAEGKGTTASGNRSHAEGHNTTASGHYSHTEGYATCTNANTIAITTTTTSQGYAAHAEGYGTVASGAISHAEGNGTTASGGGSHAEGSATIANGRNSHSEGCGTIAKGNNSHIQGLYNIEDTNDADRTTGLRKYAHIVGNGESDTARSNAHTLAWDGTAWYAGDIYVGSTSGTNMDDGSKKLATEEFVLNHSTEVEAITLDEIDEICSAEI